MHRREKLAWCLALSELLIILILFYAVRSREIAPKVVFHGGSVTSSSEHKGSCWCSGYDDYCMCTPSLAIDLLLIDEKEENVWLVRRKDTDQLATMGGFVNVGESLEETVERELKEETSIKLTEEPKLFGIY